MSTTYTRVLFNAFEQVLSSDLTRIGTLFGRELANLIGDLATSDTMWDISGVSPSPTGKGPLIPGQTSLFGYVTSGANLNINYVAGEGLSPGSPASSDEPDYNVCRWVGGTLTIVPDLVNPRADLIVARPGALFTEATSRNVLVDPVTRTVQIQTVYKVLKPSATITYLTGTPAVLGSGGSAPLPPAPAAGDLVLAEVLVPANAANSDACTVIRRTHRLSIGVLASYHGTLQSRFAWPAGPDETTADSKVTMISPYPHRFIIDGELLESSEPSFSFPDTIGGQNPFGSAAPATNDKPYYVYVCGGRWMPQWAGVGHAPFVLVHSTVAPDAFGRPTAAIGTPRGSTRAGALYVGVGFVIMNTTRGKSVDWINDWVVARSGSHQGGAFRNDPICFGDSPATVAQGLTTGLTLASVPSVSSYMRGLAAIEEVSPPSTNMMQLIVDIGSAAQAQNLVMQMVPRDTAATRASVMARFECATGQPFNVNIVCGAGVSARRVLAATAYNMRTPRLAP